MTPEQFCYWLQGFAELQQTQPTIAQWESIKEHLATVFKKVTPPILPPPIVPGLPMIPFPGDKSKIPGYPVYDFPPKVIR